MLTRTVAVLSIEYLDFVSVKQVTVDESGENADLSDVV